MSDDLFVVLAVDIGGSKYVTGFVTKSGECLWKERRLWQTISAEAVMEQLKEAILSGADLRAGEALEKHADWVEEFMSKYDEIDASNIDAIIEQEIGLVFAEVLEDAGVYKRTVEGQNAFDRFVKSLG